MTGPAEVEVRGADRDLARAAAAGARRIRFVPDATSDVARALGVPTHDPRAGDDPGLPTTEVAIDVLVLGEDLVTCNLVVHGIVPRRQRRWHRRRHCSVEVDGRPVFEGRATTVIVASGQFLAGDDLVPRGHPGDGRLEVQVQALAPGQRRAMRRRLRAGAHVPHPGIVTAQGRAVTVRWDRPRQLLVDGRVPARPARLEARLGADQVTLLI